QLPPVHQHVTMGDDLPGLRAGRGNSDAVDDAIQPPLEHLDQVFARGALGALRLDEIVAELALQQAVGALGLLLFAELQAVARELRPAALAVLPGNEVAPFDGALVREAAQALEEELDALPPAQPAYSV